MINLNIVDTDLSPTISNAVPLLNFVFYLFFNDICQHNDIFVQCVMINSTQEDIFLVEWIGANPERLIPIHNQINPTKYVAEKYP